MTRRRFLKQSLLTGSSAALVSSQPWLQLLAQEASQQERILVVIQLSGGNDGLNTVVPYKHESYYKARPKLAIQAADVVKLNDQIGLNSALRSLEKTIEDNRFSVLQGVGYAEPNRSHFESMDIWHTCQRKTNRAGYGWIGRWLSQEKSNRQALATTSSAPVNSDALAWAMHLGHEQQPLALASRDVAIPSIASLQQFRLRIGDREALKREVMQLTQATEPAKQLTSPEMTTTGSTDLLSFVQVSSQSAIQASERLEQATQGQSSTDDFPKSQLGEKLQVISQLITSGFDTRVYYVTLDGFDTHAQQPAAHTGLLRQWSEALSAFHARMNQAGQVDRVLVMTFSEFGRRVAENASDGTDHGAAAPLFLSGPKFKASIVGEHPSLTELDDGDLKFHTDFRSVYATIIQRWFRSTIDSSTILGAKFATLDLLGG